MKNLGVKFDFVAVGGAMIATGQILINRVPSGFAWHVGSWFLIVGPLLLLVRRK
jgi:hypothetical protein